jgi:hypothetical protein
MQAAQSGAQSLLLMRGSPITASCSALPACGFGQSVVASPRASPKNVHKAMLCS